MRLSYQIAGLVLLVAALFLGYYSLQLSYYSSIGPGPGFFPTWLSALLVLLALAMIAQATLRPEEPMPADFFADRAGYLRIAVALAGLFATAGLMSVLGFRVTTFVFYAVLLFALGRRNPVEIVALSAVGSLGVHYLFSNMLRQPLPAGPFGW
jgi:putative tricarboxylic transport membrane protein